MKTVADNIKHYMQVAGINQAQLARLTKIAEPTISRYVHGHREPRISNLKKISGALGCDIRDLLDFS